MEGVLFLVQGRVVLYAGTVEVGSSIYVVHRIFSILDIHCKSIWGLPSHLQNSMISKSLFNPLVGPTHKTKGLNITVL